MLATKRILAIAALALPLAGSVACKGKGGAKDRNGEFPVAVPVGGEGDATAPVPVGVIKPGDKQALQMDLQRTPPEGSVNIFACWDHPNPDLAVGRAICVDDQHVIELKAANVQFVCRTNHEYGVVPAQTALELGSCSQYKVYAYQFEPAIALELAAAK